ncbi:MAG: hypothetical protein J6Q51_01350 [Clostridia bacterium]|nr:hypothetical protein [Clostridia bacterium]
MKKISKKCPRCGQKNLEQSSRCSDCGLVFERLLVATNKAAKEISKQGKKDKVVYVTKVPSDLKKWKLILLVIFTGMFGGQYFYTGRYAKAATFLLFGTIFLIGFILSSMSLLYNGLLYVFGLTTGCLGIAWLMDIINVIINKFKIPVYIDTNKGE